MNKWDMANIRGLMHQEGKYWRLYQKYPESEMIISLFLAAEQQLDRYLAKIDINEIYQVLATDREEWTFINGFKKWDN